MRIRTWQAGDQDAVVALILGIQRNEFGFDITAADQPDLLDIPGYYLKGRGNFWVAEEQGRVIGTVGLLDIGRGDGALRKMFVHSGSRGRQAGTAATLLGTCLEWARGQGMRRVMLGTTEAFRAAHRFYEKSGFTRLDPARVPAHFPRMALDTRFYVVELGGI